jgi:hypothetical protein
VQVADDAEVGLVEDRRVRVAVDGDDRLGAADRGAVAHRAGDAACEVEAGMDLRAGEADAGVPRTPAEFAGGVRAAEAAAEGVGDACQEAEPGCGADAASPGHDDVRLGEQQFSVRLVNARPDGDHSGLSMDLATHAVRDRDEMIVIE